jgi:hypothetical protein
MWVNSSRKEITYPLKWETRLRSTAHFALQHMIERQLTIKRFVQVETIHADNTLTLTKSG